MSLSKGTHLPIGFNAALVNSVSLDFFTFTNPGLFDPVASGAGSVDAEYIHRIPSSGWGRAFYPHIRTLPNFHNTWTVLNESGAWGVTPAQAAADANSIVSDIVASDPSIDNTIILDFWSQVEDAAWRETFWGLLTPDTLTRVSAMGVHYYPQTSDPATEVRKYIRLNVHPFMVVHNIASVYLTETGFDNAVVTQAQAGDYIPLMAEQLAPIGYLKGWSWYCWAFSNYVDLSDDAQTLLKKSGKAWQAL